MPFRKIRFVNENNEMVTNYIFKNGKIIFNSKGCWKFPYKKKAEQAYEEVYPPRWEKDV